MENPRTFTEKLQWLKIYDYKPEYTQMVDKLAVKDYVASRIGKEYVIPTLAVWNSVEEIDWDSLPSQFVLKTTHGGGGCGVVVCTDKSKFDKETAIKENGIILRNKSYYEEPGKKGDVSLTNYKVGDIIDAYEIGYDEKNDKEIIETVKLKVLATTEDLLPGQLSSSYMGLDFITYDEVGQKLGFNINKGRMYISTNKEENTRKAIKEIAEKYGYTVNDEIEYARKNEQSMMAMKVFVYGFVSVISLVSITNIVNTISTNINLRKREFAIIKSIGVTPSGFNKMIYLESLLYGALSLIYGIPIGMGITILMNKTLGDVINLGMVIPWNAIIISFVGIFIITFIASYIPMKKINKENIIDSIRQESI